ncbi:hypothetical protein IWQ60_001013 [Tieghemiomyces parasiticus]|uniref:Nicotinamide phosphoribosyltransferase n=1 Tax=Tieghemiomyces parasiticus TaxID=78921 RepID=A0A9W8ADS4_9FUNG|nr:hypothetical protein IWQ60_001013 [Tieghemiomyces parasiticus]
MFRNLAIPPPILTDSYKLAHAELYPPAEKMTAYAECRHAFDKDPEDHRILFYGMRYIVGNYLNVRWTLDDVVRSEHFFAHHNAGYTEFPFPKDLFLALINEHDGYFPVKVETLPEGTVVYPHIPVYQITAVGKYAPLVTYLETLLTMVWYPLTVATLSRRMRTLIEHAFDECVDEENHGLISSRLHDFGFRGCTSVEQSIIGGCAHLVNFEGTDTLSAGYYAQFYLNGGEPLATAVPATEHSVMTAFARERDAILSTIDHVGTGIYSIVMDTYDYAYALETLLPTVAKRKLAKGGVLVVRPDSGDAVANVLLALRYMVPTVSEPTGQLEFGPTDERGTYVCRIRYDILYRSLETIFGAKTNRKGYKVLNKCAVIQGDGVTYRLAQDILAAVKEAKFSPENVALGMGSGLLQKVHRDVCSFATKLSYIEYADGSHRDTMKIPQTDKGKTSLPGQLDVIADENSLPVAYPRGHPDTAGKPSLFRTVYDHGPVQGVWDSFKAIRERAQTQWAAAPKQHEAVSEALRRKSEAFLAELKASVVAAKAEVSSSSGSDLSE